MKRNLVALLFLSVFAVTAVWSQSAGNKQSKGNPVKGKVQNEAVSMFLENESRYDFDETVEKIKAEAEKRTWKISATHDLQQTLKNSGKDVLPVKVLAICHPKHSARILEKDDERIVSSLMPCRISIYKKSNGKTYVSRLNATIMAKSFGGIVQEVMTDSTNEVEDMIGDIIIPR